MLALSLIPLPYKLLGLAALGAGLFGGGFYSGHRLAVLSEQAASARLLKETITKYEVKVTEYNNLAQQLEVSKRENHAITEALNKEVDKIINRPVYRTACFDAAGLRIANAALAGKSPDPGIPAPTLP